jgi:rod shape-determining protein MreC
MYHGEPPPFLYRGPSIVARFVFFGLLALALIFVDSRYRYLETVRGGLTVALYPLQNLARWPSQIFHDASVYFRSKNALADENETMQQKLLNYEYTEQTHLNVRHENEQLRALLGVRESAQRQVVPVEVFHGVRDPFVQKLTVNKGSRHHIKEGAAVLDAHGIAGQVTRVFPFTAEVTLIVEKNFITPVQNARTGVRSVLYGTGAGQAMELRFVTPDSDIREGDLLVTSGLENIYPVGLSVAMVRTIEHNPEEIFLHITADPVASAGDSRYLLVVEPLPTSHDPAQEALDDEENSDE